MGPIKTQVEEPQMEALADWLGEAGPMPAAHRHNDVELNLLLGGRMVYLLAGRRVELRAGAMGLFWAAHPHQVVEAEGVRMWWTVLPLAVVMQWDLPKGFMRQLLEGRMLTHALSTDMEMIRRWHEDLTAGDPGRRAVVSLEVEARIRRAALAGSRASVEPPGVGRGDKIHQIAEFIARHYRRPIAVADVAEHVGLHPSYAMNLFRQRCGVTIVQHINHHRVCHAQRLLATTDRPIEWVATDSGFGSISRFYAAFTGVCGQSPKAYRRMMHRS